MDDIVVPPLLWSPAPEEVQRAALTRFAEQVTARHGVAVETYADLWTWSVTEIDDFWSAVWEFYDVGELGAAPVLPDRTMPGARWFPRRSLNFAEHLLRPRADDDAVALVTAGEDGPPATLTWAELRAQAAAFAATLRRLGVGLGDRVLGYLPNIGEAVVAFLGTAAVGAIWSSVGQDYAAPAVVDRFGQLRGKVLVTADGYRFAGQPRDRLAAVEAVRAGLLTVEHTIVVRRLGVERDLPGALGWDQAIAEPAEHRPVPVPFEHPLWVLFSSGTTGLPKGLVHSHGGILLEELKTWGLQWDVDATDRVFWFTSPSWVMWNIQLGALLLGATLVCYDGSPRHPDDLRLWRLVDELGLTVLGTSPAYLQACQRSGVSPATECDLGTLRSIGTTGSPLSAATHTWATEQSGGRPVFSISGGTDVGTAFCGGAATVPVRAGEIPVPYLGAAMEAWGADGRPVVGSVGDLVITQPMPSMPVAFWDDPDGARYREAYFATFPGVWRHGDWITITERGSVVVHGRSDSTLNRHGIRMGSADIYTALEPLPEVLDALVVGAEQPDGTYWMPLFVVLAEGMSLDEPLRARIAEAIRTAASPRHVPDEVIQVPGIPRTRTGKRLEVPIKRLLQGQPLDRVANPATIEDPDLLHTYAQFAAGRTGTRAPGL